jgi:predicted MFS family arabinose efflux permease
MVQPGLLRSRRRLSGLAIIALVVGAQGSMFFLTVQYLERDLGFGPLSTGLAFLPLTLGIFAMSRITPRLLRAVGRTPMFVTGTTGLAVSFAWLSQITPGDSYLTGAFGPMVLNGIAAGLVFLPATSGVLAGVAPEHAGSASGLLQTFQQLGGAIGLAVIVSVYAAGAVPGRFLPGADHAFLTSAAGAGRGAGARGGRHRGGPRSRLTQRVSGHREWSPGGSGFQWTWLDTGSRPAPATSTSSTSWSTTSRRPGPAR